MRTFNSPEKTGKKQALVHSNPGNREIPAWPEANVALHLWARLDHRLTCNYRNPPDLLVFPEGLVLRDGWFVIHNPQEHVIIEQKPMHGREIFSWRLEP